MNPRARYPFLEVWKESEAVARGVNLTEKITHTVYKAVQSRSSAQEARRNGLFTADTPVPEIVNLTRKDLLQLLGRMNTDRAIAQIFRLDYEPGQPAPRLVCCYITQPPDEKDTIYHIFSEVVAISARAVGVMLDAAPAASEANIRQDLETDLRMEKSPQAADLPATLVSPFDLVHASKFDLLPAPELIQRSIEDIREDLLRNNRAIELINYGLMPRREAELLLRFETASDFLVEKLIPRYRAIGGLKRQIEDIRLEESARALDVYAPPTTQFAVQRAQALKQAAQSEQGARGGRFQGQLATEMILALASLCEPLYQSRHKTQIEEQISRMRAQLNKRGADWRSLILFLTEEDRDKLPPEVFQGLSQDPALIYTTWQRREAGVHCFVGRNSDSFRALARAMQTLRPEESWQALALRALLEIYERQFPDLFEDSDFLRDYGRMLRNAYFHYMPWYHRVLLQFGITWFQDGAFQHAKKAIQGEQTALAETNDSRAAQRREQREAELKDKRLKISQSAQVNRVLEALDQEYIEAARIPSVGEVRRRLGEPDDAAFRDFLSREGFQLLPGGKEQPPEDAVLLYPMNHEWRVRVARLRRTIDRILEQEATAAPEMLARARRLQKRLSRPESGGSGAAIGAAAAVGAANDPDAYSRFSDELAKYEKRSAAGDGNATRDERDGELEV